MATKRIKYLKEDLLLSKTLGLNRDVLMVVLEDEKSYTKKEAEKLYNAFLKKEVK